MGSRPSRRCAKVLAAAAVGEVMEELLQERQEARLVAEQAGPFRTVGQGQGTKISVDDSGRRDVSQDAGECSESIV